MDTCLRRSLAARDSVSLAMLFVILVSVPCPAQAENETATNRPNILVILADDMGYGDISCYGSRQIQTPNIDSLADDGIRCTQGYVSMMVCAPSRAGIMTGRYQSRFGFEQNLLTTRREYYVRELVGLPLDEVTVADRLKAAGYHTACIGKWHLGGSEAHHPNSRGFDYYFGRFKGHGYFPTVEKQQIYRQREPVKSIDVPYTTDWYTKETIDYLQRVPDGEPWFVYLAHDTPHTPLQAKPQDIEKFKHIRPKNRRTYCAMQHCLDENVGRLLKYLRDSGQRDNTLIVFLSDNGGTCNGSINAPLRGRKATFLEGGLRVPMIFSWPAGLPTGKTYTQPVISLDFLPTFAEAAGAELPAKPEIDGVSLLSHLREEESPENGDARPHEKLFFRMTLRGAAYRDHDWKLVRLPHRPPELYDLSTDTSELNNLAADNQDRVRRMMYELNVWEQGFKDTPRWFNSNGWIKGNREAYDQQYQLTQPE